MKILHTSDWHIGASLNQEKRYDEFEKVLNHLVQTLREKEIQTIIIAGDVFDSSLPTNRAAELYYSFLANAKTAGVKNIIITAGNHDSASFLEAPGHILQYLNVFISGQVDPENPDPCIIPLYEEKQKLSAVVCSVPYLREKDIRRLTSGEDIDAQETKRLEGIKKYYSDICARAKQLYPNAPLIVTGHFYADETNYYDAPDAVPVNTLGIDVDYFALGHLHSYQKVPGKLNAYYSGSLVQMRCNEKMENKKMLLLDTCDLQKEPEIIELPVFQKLEKISGSMEEIHNRLDELILSGEDVWIDVLNTGNFEANLQPLLASKCAGTTVKLISCDNSKINPALSQYRRNSVKLEEVTPKKIFERLLEGIAEEKRPELLGAFNEAVRSLEEDDANAE